MKPTIFINQHTNSIISDLNITPEERRENLKHIHITITSRIEKTRKLLTPYDRMVQGCRHRGPRKYFCVVRGPH